MKNISGGLTFGPQALDKNMHVRKQT